MRRAVWLALLALSTWSWAQTNTGAKPAPKPVARPAAPKNSAPAAPQPVVVKAGHAVTIAPAPSWVVPPPATEGAPGEAAPMHYRLIDEQVRVEGSSSAEHVQVVRVVNQAAGLGTAAQFELEYDPAFESVVLHGLDVLRDGQRLPRLDRQRIEILQREKQLEHRIYDGRITVSIVVDDVRVGDELDLRYTRIGQNPVFGGRFVRYGWMSSDRGPVRTYRTRLLAPEARQIRHAVDTGKVAVDSVVRDGWRDTRFVRERVPQLNFEPGAPFAAFRDEYLQLSEFASWAEVARWGDQLFQGAATGRAAAEHAATIRAAQPDTAGRVLEALRFVQQDVRYFGVEMGIGSHRPHPADQVLQQRFGDCKDKVTLLSALLRSLQVPVKPVLVNTRLRDRFDGWIPSPLAFDHVIARVELDGQVLYLDPTRAHQSGPVAARSLVGFGRGLELAPEVSDLTALPSPQDVVRLSVEDRFTVQHFTEPVRLVSQIVYRGDLGELFRELIARQGLAAVSDRFGSPYLKAYPSIRRLGPPAVLPAPDDDALVIEQAFEIPDFWRFPEQRLLLADVFLWAPLEMLMPPKMESRKQPAAFPYPGITRHVAIVRLPEDVYRQNGSRSGEDGDEHFRLRVSQSSTLRTVETVAEARITADRVEPARWQAFNATLSAALPKLGFVTAVPAIPLARTDALQARVRALDDDIRRGRLKVVTPTQAESHVKLAVLTAQIDGGRLAGKPKVEALVARGIAFDHVGRLDDAGKDFADALSLAPTSIAALNGGATNAAARGRNDEAVALADRALAQEPTNADALGTRALAHFLAGRAAAARDDWSRLLKEPGSVQRGYPLALLALATRRTGGDLDALKRAYPPDRWPDGWPRPLIELALNGGDGRAALAAAKSQKQAVQAQTEAYFYLAELVAAAGDLRAARGHWQSAVDLGVVEFVEYNAARQRLSDPR